MSYHSVVLGGVGCGLAALLISHVLAQVTTVLGLSIGGIEAAARTLSFLGLVVGS